MKEMRVQVRRPQSPLTFGAAVLMTMLILGFPQDAPAESGQSCEALKPPVAEVPVQRLNGKVESFAPTVKKVAPAVVRIVTALRLDELSNLAGKTDDPLSHSFFGQAPEGGSRRSLECGLGSGVIVTEDGYILTNSHLVNGPAEIKVTLQDGREFNAKVVGLDPKSDVAVIKINAHHLPTVPLAESHNAQVGDLVLAIGNPFGGGPNRDAWDCQRD